MHFPISSIDPWMANDFRWRSGVLPAVTTLNVESPTSRVVFYSAPLSPGSLVWAKLWTWGWWPGRVAELGDFRQNKKKYESMRAEKNKKTRLMIVENSLKQTAIVSNENDGRQKANTTSTELHKPELLLITFYGDSTWSWMTRDKVM